MIPGPLVAPAIAPPREPRGGVAARVLGVALIVLAGTGAWAWFTVMSPFSFERWEVFETSSTMPLEPGTYTVFEEFPDAGSDSSRPRLAVVVRSIAGREVDVTQLETGPRADPAQVMPDPYRTPWHEGRATAQFEIDRAGTYTVTAFPSEASSTGLDYNELLTSHVAVAPDGEPGPLGSGWGLLAVTFLPLALGLGVLTVARIRWPRSRPSRARRYPAAAG